MSGWLDKLKKFIKVKFNITSPLFNINIVKNSNNTKIILQNGIKIDEKNKILHIDTSILPKGLLKEATQSEIEAGNKIGSSHIKWKISNHMIEKSLI